MRSESAEETWKHPAVSTPTSYKGPWSANEGDCLFQQPLVRYFRENALPELFRKTEGLNDDRLLAIVTALIVEDRLDACLNAFLPRYSRLTSATEFGFSTKIALMEALAFIPPKILSAADVIRKVRNEFAHHLALDSFSGLKPKLTADAMNLRADVFGTLNPSERTPKQTFREEYKSLAFFCIVALDTYRENLSYLRLEIQTPAFVQHLHTQCALSNEQEMNAIVSKGPVSKEIRDGVQIQKFERGVVRLDLTNSESDTIDLGKVLDEPVD